MHKEELLKHMEIEITGSNVKEHNLFSCPDCIVVKACKVINYIQHELTNMKCTYCTKEDLHWPLRRQIFHHTLSEGPWLCLGPSELRHTTHHSCSWGQHLLSSKRKKNNYWWLKIKSEQQIIHGHSVVTVLLKKITAWSYFAQVKHIIFKGETSVSWVERASCLLRNNDWSS